MAQPRGYEEAASEELPWRTSSSASPPPAQLAWPPAWGSAGRGGGTHQPVGGVVPLSRHLGMRDLGGRARTCPSLSPKPPGLPARCGHHGRGEGGHLARCDLFPTGARLPCPSPGSLQTSTDHRPSLLPESSWYGQGNHLMSQQCGECRGGAVGGGPAGGSGPTRHPGHLQGSLGPNWTARTLQGERS